MASTAGDEYSKDEQNAKDQHSEFPILTRLFDYLSHLVRFRLDRLSYPRSRSFLRGYSAADRTGAFRASCGTIGYLLATLDAIDQSHWPRLTEAPRTIHNIYGDAHAMFRDAVVEELIEASPCVLPRGELPPKVDKDPEWRTAATYSVAEVERLISDTAIPPERRVMYAVKAIAGLRHGEVAGLRWRHYDAELEPLGRLLVATSYDSGRTKTDVTRRVPVHPTLAKILAAWKLSHWERIYGRAPGVDDLIVPARTMGPIAASDGAKMFKEDLRELGLRTSAGEFRDRGGTTSGRGSSRHARSTARTVTSCASRLRTPSSALGDVRPASSSRQSRRPRGARGARLLDRGAGRRPGAARRAVRAVAVGGAHDSMPSWTVAVTSPSWASSPRWTSRTSPTRR